MTTTAWRCERAWLGGATAARDVVVTATDGVIDEVVVGGTAPAGAQHLEGLVLPGLANAHSHAFHRALRGRQHEGLATFWDWRDQMYELASKLTPDTLRSLATATFAEMLCAGFTTVGEFHYLHHDVGGGRFGDPHEMSRALFEAAAASGIRLTLLDTCYLTSSPGEPPRGAQSRFADDDVDEFLGRLDALGPPPPRVAVAAAVHSVRAVPPSAIAAVASWSEACGAPLHAHVSEQPAENDAARAAYGATPTAVLAGAGALSERFSAIHATHLEPHDAALLGEARATVCVCPTTERDLGDGLVDLAALREAGVGVTVGTDSHASIDPFEELRALEGHERLRTGRRGTLDAAALLLAGTGEGHRALGWRGGGRLAVGSPCDLVAVRTDSVRTAGTGGDVTGLVAGAAGADVRTVVVGGELVVADGQHRRLDVASSLERAVAAAWS